MILSGQTIKSLGIITPTHNRTIIHGMTYGLGPASYDVRIKQELYLEPLMFSLASTIEHFDMPTFVAGQLCDKSTWARKGLSLFNTFIDPGWKGYLTLELVNNSGRPIHILAGSPIGQVVFSKLDHFAEEPYNGKYMFQKDEPVNAIYEKV